MKKEGIIFNYKGKKISLDTLKCEGVFDMGRGLTFRRRERAPALLFDFGKRVRFALTAFFVFFPFYVLWLDEKNKVLEAKLVKPFRFHINSKKPFTKIVEIPVNRRYAWENGVLVGV